MYSPDVNLLARLVLASIDMKRPPEVRAFAALQVKKWAEDARKQVRGNCR